MQSLPILVFSKILDGAMVSTAEPGVLTVLWESLPFGLLLHALVFPLTLTLFLVCLHLSVLCFVSSVELFPILTLQWETDGIGFTPICGPVMNSEVVVVGILRLRRHCFLKDIMCYTSRRVLWVRWIKILNLSLVPASLEQFKKTLQWTDI